MIVLVNSQGEIERIVASAEFENMSGLTALQRNVPAGYPETRRWNPQSLAFEPFTPPRRLSGLQILALYTPAQHARIRRMLFATFPSGHPQAGELVDPDGLVQRLADATLAMPGTILVTDPLHVNGTTLYRAMQIIESDEEAARIAAGITPEEWAAGVRP